MKKLVQRIVFAISLCSFSSIFALDGLSFTVGRWPNTNVWGGRIAAQWQWDWWLCKKTTCGVDLTGYWDSSFAHWRSYKRSVRGKRIYIWAISPVLRLVIGAHHSWSVKPFLEAGVGGAFVSQTRFANRRLSSKLLFEDRLGWGLTLGKRVDLMMHYRHYSNANIVRPNEGLDLYTATIAYRF